MTKEQRKEFYGKLTVIVEKIDAADFQDQPFDNHLEELCLLMAEYRMCIERRKNETLWK
jgi:hypothetical protein